MTQGFGFGFGFLGPKIFPTTLCATAEPVPKLNPCAIVEKNPPPLLSCGDGIIVLDWDPDPDSDFDPDPDTDSDFDADFDAGTREVG